MKNQELLDQPPQTNQDAKPDWRFRYLIVESGIIFLLFLFALLSRSGFKIVVEPMIVLIFGLMIFYFVVPIIKVIRKEIKAGLFALYILQAFAAMGLILGFMFKVENWPYANEFVIAGIISIWPFFLLTPNVEIRKYKAKAFSHLLITLLGIAMTLGYFGWLFKMEAWPYGNEFSVTGTILGVLVLIVILFKLRQSEEHFYLKCYLPRLALLLFFTISLPFT